MTATIDRIGQAGSPLREVDESFANPSLTGYGLFAFGGYTIQSVTDDEPARLHMRAEGVPTSITVNPQLLWPARAVDPNTAENVGGHELVSASPSLVSTFSRIKEMSNLPPNWDREGADPPTGRAVAAACHLIALVRLERLQRGMQDGMPASSSPLADGGLQVEWESGTCRIDVQLNEDGSYGFLGRCGAGPSVEYDESDDVSLEEVLTLIHQVLDS